MIITCNYAIELLIKFLSMLCHNRFQSKQDLPGHCGRCSLCGNHGSHNSVVPLMKHIRTLDGKRRLIQKLSCKDYGICAAYCKNCDITMSVKQ